jgi:uncharacterized RDD family membrane protein YckC
MNDPNPYSAPRSSFETEVAGQDLRLGGRGERLGAAFIDGIIALVLVLPMMYFLGVFDYAMRGQQAPLWLNLSSSVLGFLIFLLVQGYPLSQAGQTWGKRALKLKIVDLAGNKPDFLRLVGLRYGVTQLAVLVPLLGPFYSFVDALFIFRNDRRCIHDLIAGTRVVVAD